MFHTVYIIGYSILEFLYHSYISTPLSWETAPLNILFTIRSPESYVYFNSYQLSYPNWVASIEQIVFLSALLIEAEEVSYPLLGISRCGLSTVH